MGLVSNIVKIGLVTAGVVYGQRIWDGQKLDNLEGDLHHLELTLRADKERKGTLVANMKVLGQDIVDEYRRSLFLAHTVHQLELRFNVYLESIVEPSSSEETTAEKKDADV